ncbi:hypothetical protein [Nocardioides ochotonae]|uniref:hypothetical protein n=1 Tax=Nocardioides ochotonae TaxID=2685869 RepID=UPI00140CB255|nr:hypothetical protein [Nocardioides ochotonae]
MSEQTAEATATETEATTEQTNEQKPTETVDFWKQKAREQEKRAKENASAAQRLAEIEDAKKSESEKVAERIAKAETEVAAIPSKVADGLRAHLVELHGIDTADAELFLTANDPELLLKQVTRLVGQSDKRTKNRIHVPREGNTSRPAADGRRSFLRGLTGQD